jgi:hypothetical protein
LAARAVVGSLRNSETCSGIYLALTLWKMPATPLEGRPKTLSPDVVRYPRIRVADVNKSTEADNVPGATGPRQRSLRDLTLASTGSKRHAPDWPTMCREAPPITALGAARPHVDAFNTRNFRQAYKAAATVRRS